MINRIIILFKIARKIGSSNIIEIVDRSHKVPFFIKLFFNLVSLSFSKNQKKNRSYERFKFYNSRLGDYFYKTWTILSDKTGYHRGRTYEKFRKIAG